MSIIPTQKDGKQYDHIEFLELQNNDEANLKYNEACKKLMNINDWGHIGDSILKTVFCLCNNDGEEKMGTPVVGNYIRINLTGPGTKSGDGYDWVKIEEIITENNGGDNLSSITVRPASTPLNDDPAVAHFFKDKATTTFLITQKGKRVSAEIHGRNEEPNVETGHITDNVRNTVAATLAFIKFSDIQWKNLCKGFLK